MGQKTKGGFLPTLLVIAALGAGAYFFLPSVNGNKSEDEIQQVVTLTVAFDPNRNDRNPIKITYVKGPEKPVEELATTSPWRKVVMLRRGDLMLLGAIQSSPGTLTCSIKERGQTLAHDNNALPGQPVRNWVKCVTGA